MKAVSVHQPWAWAILHAGKNVENRTWATSHRGPLLIHAAVSRKSYARQDAAQWPELYGVGLPAWEELTTGAIIGSVEVVDCVWVGPCGDLGERGKSVWALEGYFGWILANPRPLPNPTVRATMRLAEDQFHFLWGVLDAKSLWAGGADIPKGESEYAESIVSCARAAFIRGELSLAGLTAVYQLHASWVGPLEGVPTKVARAVMSRPTLMLPDMPDLVPPGGDALGVVQTRLFFDFLRRAWAGRWPTDQDGETIRSCEVVADLVDSLRSKRLVRPCVYRWYEC
jgi:hypothetical protein